MPAPGEHTALGGVELAPSVRWPLSGSTGDPDPPPPVRTKAVALAWRLHPEVSPGWWLIVIS